MCASALARGSASNNIIIIVYRKYYIIDVLVDVVKRKEKSIGKFRYLIDRRLSTNENLVYIILFEGLGEERNKKISLKIISVE